MNDYYDPLNTPRHRFETDPKYRNLVQYLEALIHAAEFTPSELREAIIFACIRYEQMNIHRIVISKDDAEVIQGLEAIERFVTGKKSEMMK